MSLAELFFLKNPRRFQPFRRKRFKRLPSRRKPIFEALEPRLLLSADLLPVVTPDLNTASNESALVLEPVGTPEPVADVTSTETAGGDADEFIASPSGERTGSEEGGGQIIFVDPAVADYETLLEGLSLSEGSDLEVVILDAARDGIAQITDVLAAHENDLAGIHILSHGSTAGRPLPRTPRWRSGPVDVPGPPGAGART